MLKLFQIFNTNFSIITVHNKIGEGENKAKEVIKFKVTIYYFIAVLQIYLL